MSLTYGEAREAAILEMEEENAALKAEVERLRPDLDVTQEALRVLYEAGRLERLPTVKELMQAARAMGLQLAWEKGGDR